MDYCRSIVSNLAARFGACCEGWTGHRRGVRQSTQMTCWRTMAALKRVITFRAGVWDGTVWHVSYLSHADVFPQGGLFCRTLDVFAGRCSLLALEGLSAGCCLFF
jgi:hypothetical protein